MCKIDVTDRFWNPAWISWQIDQPLDLSNYESTHLDLGSGRRPANPFAARRLIASDIQDIEFQENDKFDFIKIINLSAIPLPDSSVDSISAYDLLEHIPRSWPNKDGGIRFPFIELMNEISRVLKPGGVFLAVTPAFPNGPAFQDPTHINIITSETISYFDENNWANTLGYGYFGTLKKVHQSWLRGSGPYLGRYSRELSLQHKSDSLMKRRIMRPIRLVNRVFRLCIPHNSFALLWVLRKPCEFD
jgi:SAM-dependent methyltransferase